MGRLKNKGILLYILAVVVLYVIIYIVPKVTGLLDVTYVAEYGELSIFDEGTCYLVRNERVYLAQGTGQISKVSAEGTLLRAGSSPVSVSGAEIGTPPEELKTIRESLGDDAASITGYYLEKGGIVSYYVDGHEAELGPDTMESLKKSYFDGLSQDGVFFIDKLAYYDYPIFKVVSNDNWYVVAYLSNAKGDYEAGRRIYVELDGASADGGSRRVEMRIVSASEGDGYLKVILKTSRVIDSLGALRVTNGKLVASDERGLLIERQSLVVLEGKVGIYVKNTRNKYDFVPVNIIGENGDTVVISDSYYYDENGERVRTADPFVDVLRDPSGLDGEPFGKQNGSAEEPQDEAASGDAEAEADAGSDAGGDAGGDDAGEPETEDGE